MPFTTLKNWLRPSIQQPRRIKQIIDKLTSPVLHYQQVVKEYWDTWHLVYQQEKTKDDNNQRKES